MAREQQFQEKVVNVPRSLLFIPGNTAKMLDKALAFRPDAYVPDMEDSVPDAEKENARHLRKHNAPAGELRRWTESLSMFLWPSVLTPCWNWLRGASTSRSGIRKMNIIKTVSLVKEAFLYPVRTLAG